MKNFNCFSTQNILISYSNEIKLRKTYSFCIKVKLSKATVIYKNKIL